VCVRAQYRPSTPAPYSARWRDESGNDSVVAPLADPPASVTVSISLLIAVTGLLPVAVKLPFALSPTLWVSAIVIGRWPADLKSTLPLA